MPMLSYPSYSAAVAAHGRNNPMRLNANGYTDVWVGETARPPWQPKHRNLKSVVSVEEYGAVPGVASTANTTAIQTAMNATALAGKILWFPPGVWKATSRLLITNNLHIMGSGRASRIEKCFTTVGNTGLLSPLTGGAGITADDVTIENIELGAVSHTIDGVKTNKLLMAVGNRWTLRNVFFKTWSGWACNLGGDDHVCEGLYFEDPMLVGSGDTNGIDGLHILYGNNIQCDGVYGEATDDFIAVIAPATGAFANRPIDNVRIKNVRGHSNAARFLAIGSFDEAITSPHSNISISNAYGTIGGSPNTAGAYAPCVWLCAVGAPLTDVTLDHFHFDGSLSQDGIKISAQQGVERVLIRDGMVVGGDQSITGSATGITIQSGTLTDLQIVNTMIDASLSTYGFNTPSAHTIDMDFYGRVLAGSGHAMNLHTVPASTGLRPTINARIDNIKSGQSGVYIAYSDGATFTLDTNKGAGATGTVGLTDTANSTNVTLADCDFSGVDMSRV